MLMLHILKGQQEMLIISRRLNLRQIILRHIDLEIKPGETRPVRPKRLGKTSLLMTIMGYPQYKVTGGRILFKGVDITHSPINERARLGVACPISGRPRSWTKNPPDGFAVRGRKEADAARRAGEFQRFLDRDVNAGSPAVKSNAQILQLMARTPISCFRRARIRGRPGKRARGHHHLPCSRRRRHRQQDTGADET